MALAQKMARDVNGGREARGRLGSSIDAERAALFAAPSARAEREASGGT